MSESTMPLVSVIIPVYNAERYLCDTIDSVLAQNFGDYEIILVNDCSRDSSLEIMYRYASVDRRIRVYSNEINSGVAKTRNKGILEARGKYIALLDSDDVWRTDKLEKQLKLLNDTGAQIAYCSYDFIDENGISIKTPFIVPDSTDYEKMLVSSVISCSTALIEADLLKHYLFNPEFYHEDYVLWMEILSSGANAVGDPSVLASYRLLQGSRSNNKANSAYQRWVTYRRALGLSFVKSCWVMIRYAWCAIRKYYL